MEKIKNAFKPDVQKEAEARKAEEQAQQQGYSTTSSSANPTSSNVPQPTRVSSDDLEQQPSTSIGTGGGLTESSESKYGATPGHGISSYQADPSTTTSGYSTGTGQTTYTTNAPQIGANNAPKIGLPDFGESVTAALGTGAGNGPSHSLLQPGEDASDASIKSGVIGSGRLTSYAPGTTTTSTTTTDPNVPTTSSVGQSAYESGTHPTFTGNRLDPAIKGSSTTTDYSSATAVGTGVVATGAAGTAGAYEYSQSKQITDNTGTTHGTQPIEEKKGGLSSLLHRDNPNKLQKEPKGGSLTSPTTDSTPNKLHKEPKEGYGTSPTTDTTSTSYQTTNTTTATAAAAGATTAAAYTTTETEPRTSTTTGTSSSSYVKPAAHETFVRPGRHHEQHIGVDGPIGRPTEVSGIHGTDARRTSVATEIDKTLDPNNPALLRPEDREPSLAEREAQLGEGRVVDPFTGLVKNVGKFGTGAGGTDGAPQIQGYDEATQAERLKIHDEQREANKEMTWEKIKNDGDGF